MSFDPIDILYNVSMVFLIIAASFIFTKWVGKRFGDDPKEDESP